MPALPLRIFHSRKRFWQGRAIASYLFALLLVLIAAFSTALLLPYTKNMVLLLFCTAITLSAIQGGFGPGVIATFVSTLIEAYWFFPPDHSFAVDQPGALKLSIFCSAGVLISGLCERMHSARRASDLRWQEAEATQKRQDLLSQLGATLTAATPLELSLQNVALIVTRKFSGLCLIDILGQDKKLHRMAVSSSDLLNKDFEEQIAARYPVDVTLSYGPAEVARTGRPEVIRRLKPETPHHQVLESAGFHAFLSLPLYAPGRRLGVVTLAFSESQAELRPEELTLATEITRLIAIRVANESLLWAAQEEIARLKQGMASEYFVRS